MILSNITLHCISQIKWCVYQSDINSDAIHTAQNIHAFKQGTMKESVIRVGHYV